MLKVGIVAAVRNKDDIHQVHADQHIYHMVQALKATNFVDMVYIVAGSEIACEESSWTRLNVPVITPSFADGGLDVFIEVTAAMDARYVERQRKVGAKFILASLAHPFFAGLAEPAIFNKPVFIPGRNRYDQVWIQPQFAEFKELLQTQFKVPVEVTPFLWTKEFIVERAGVLAKEGTPYGYKPGSLGENMRVGVIEQNLTLTRNFMIPMLAIDLFDREVPGVVKHMHVLSTKNHIQHKTLVAAGVSLNLVQTSRASFDDTLDIPAFMAIHANMVVAHQWLHDRDYTHLELLHGNYPLVHNSGFLSNYRLGAYYHRFAARAASQGMVYMLEEHDAVVANGDDVERFADLCRDVNPQNPMNIDAYRTLVLALSFINPL